MPTARFRRSTRTGDEIDVVHYGQRGSPLLYLPSSSGDEREFTRYGLDRVAEPWIAAGRIQVFASDGRGPSTWWNDRLPPPERVRSYARFEESVKSEIVPWIRERCGGVSIAAIGPSYGAFVAANLAFKLPESVTLGCGFGGVYGLWHRLDGHHDDDVYFHTPLEFLPRMEDPRILSAIRAGRGFDLFAAADDSWRFMTERMRDVLSDRRIPHRFEVWGSPAEHHEHWWARQLRTFLTRRFGSFPE